MEQETVIQQKKSSNMLVKILIALLIITGGGAYYFYQKATFDPQKAAQKELVTVTKQVSRHMVLPTDETPSVATVSDPEKLKDQKFFVNSQVGDKVIVYSLSRKAILYRPSLDRIIEVAPVNVTGTQ